MTQYFDLFIRCPACITKGKSGDPASFWYHANCNGKLQVGEDATFRCASCQDTRHVRDWRYACAAHRADYQPTSSADVANAVSTAAQLVNQTGRHWLITFLENLGDW